jgi:hypothetical protein
MNYWTNKTELKAKIDMTAHNLMCYSANMLMTEPKPGFEKDFRIMKENLKILRNWYEGMKD